MNVKELKEAIENLPDDMEVILQKDPEGNTEEMREMKDERFYTIVGVVFVFVLIMLALFWSPVVGPWVAERKGLAEFRQAEQNRQIRIQEARSKKEAAEFLAEAEITKAGGVAEANNIMAKSLGGPEGYLRWKYIEMLEETGQNSNTIVYIPTEAAMPVLEAGRVSDAVPTDFN